MADDLVPPAPPPEAGWPPAFHEVMKWIAAGVVFGTVALFAYEGRVSEQFFEIVVGACLAGLGLKVIPK